MFQHRNTLYSQECNTTFPSLHATAEAARPTASCKKTHPEKNSQHQHGFHSGDRIVNHDAVTAR